MNVVFRVNIKNVGYGHFKRCLSIAKELVERDLKVNFFVDDASAMDIMHACNINIHVIEHEHVFYEFIFHKEIHGVILDGYFANEQYIKNLKLKFPNIFIVILDSLKRGLMGGDLLVNQALYAKDFYKNEHHNKRYLLGERYVILSDEYKNKSTYVLREVQSVLITMGGLDPNDITLKLLPYLLVAYPKIKFVVILGKYFESKEAIINLRNTYNNLCILENLTSLKNIIDQCDICISAAGTTVFEIARCGRPMMIFAQEENQLFTSKYWEQQRGILNMGYFNEKNMKIYLKNLNELIINSKLRKKQSDMLLKNSQYGTSNLVDELIKNLKTNSGDR